AEGIASVRFDLSGHGESDGDFFDVTITGEIAETRAVLRTVRTLDFVDPDRIGLVGMSMGGVVAGITAADPFEIGGGHLKGRPLAPEIAEKGYVDTGGHRMSAALVEDIAGLDVYGRSGAYTGPVHILHGDMDDIAPLEYVRRYLDHYDGNAELEVVAGADHAWGSVPHRTTLHESTLRFFREHLQR
ncbi:alpha/beta hydrolase, partial [Streptomyces griseiscabiei]|uniref:alpha/beta hydrolase n=1 Tax=Streptomyces griseiscabiei TaxID=2993540 RepID=UPI000D19F70D